MGEIEFLVIPPVQDAALRVWAMSAVRNDEGFGRQRNTPDWMAAGAALTVIPVAGYLITRDALFVPAALVLLSCLSFLVAVFMAFRWWLSVAATCFVMPFVGFLVIRCDLALARYRAHHDSQAFTGAGQKRE